MLIFLDTEFTDFLNCDLISIGMVSEDGQHEFYSERTDFNYEWCSDFARSAVWPHLGQFPEAKAKQHELTLRLIDWFAKLPCSVTIACDSFTDWELLHDALNGNTLNNLTGRYDLRPLIDTAVFSNAVCCYHKVHGQPWHHALHDARANRMGWIAWTVSHRVDP